MHPGKAGTAVIVPPELDEAVLLDRSHGVSLYCRHQQLRQSPRVVTIDRLRELRTALISAAVTGKIDVREETPASSQGNPPSPA